MGGLPGRRAATAQSLSCLRRGRSDVAAAIDKLPAEDCVQSAADPLCIPAACSDKTAAQIEYPGQNGGCTCVSCGLEVAWGLVPESDRTGRGGRPPTIILLTDGCVVAHPGRCLIPRPSPEPQRSETSLTRVPPSHRGQNANGLPKTAEDQAESMKNEGARFMVIGTGGRWKRRGPPPKAEGSPAQHWLGARPERRIGAVLFASQASATASVMKPLTPSPARPSTPALSVYPTGLSLRTLLSALAHAHGASAAEKPESPPRLAVEVAYLRCFRFALYYEDNGVDDAGAKDLAAEAPAIVQTAPDRPLSPRGFAAAQHGTPQGARARKVVGLGGLK